MLCVRPEDSVDATQNVDVARRAVSGALKAAAVSLQRNRQLTCVCSRRAPGPAWANCDLPESRPGSSIMPGKVNPVMSELVNQVVFQIQGNDLVVALAAQHGQLELNVMAPVLMHNLFESSVQIFADTGRVFARTMRSRDRTQRYETLQYECRSDVSPLPRSSIRTSATKPRRRWPNGKPSSQRSPFAKSFWNTACCPRKRLDAILTTGNDCTWRRTTSAPQR